MGRMTRYRAIHIQNLSVTVINFDDIEQAEEYDMRMLNDKTVRTMTTGDINGDIYTVIYYHDKSEE